MSSIREFVTKDLERLIVGDAKKHRIFNEADLQMRTAHHIIDRFIAHDTRCVLFNQLSMSVGRGRGAKPARPDILVCDGSGPLAAFELKCHLDHADLRLGAIKSGIEGDIDSLRRFCQRYDVEYVFAIALLNVTDPAEFQELERHFKVREPWMKHRFRLHLIDLRRKIRGHAEWEAERHDKKQLAFARPIERPEARGWLDQIGLR